MKVAKLEMKVVLALFLAGFDYDTVDGAGRPLTAVPEIDRNDIHLVRPAMHPPLPCSLTESFDTGAPTAAVHH
jgi:sterol 14-demethylase